MWVVFFLPSETSLLLGATSINAQVAIGIHNPNLEPRTGAVLDLQGDGSLGLLLPQVPLTAAKLWTPVEGEEVDGMLVYNDSDDLDGKGAYVWYDNRWNKLGLPDGSDTHIVKDIDGNSYHYACFGVAGCWMQENLKTTKYANGDGIPYKNGSNNTPVDYDKKEYDYPNRDDQSTAYGLLYTWAAASRRAGVSDDESNKSDQASVQGVCPIGWHLPSDYEWSQLEEVIDKNATNKYASSSANAATVDYYEIEGFRGLTGEKMKSVNQVSGSTQDTHGSSNALDQNGFCALLTGHVDRLGIAVNYGISTYYWTCSNFGQDYAVVRGMRADNNGVYAYGLGPKYNLYSVRCKKN